MYSAFPVYFHGFSWIPVGVCNYVDGMPPIECYFAPINWVTLHKMHLKLGIETKPKKLMCKRTFSCQMILFLWAKPTNNFELRMHKNRRKTLKTRQVLWGCATKTNNGRMQFRL